VDHLQRIVNDWLATIKPVKPYDWQALVRAGRLRGIPADPTGKVFYLGPDSGRVAVAGDSPLRPLPDENAPGPPS